MKILILLHSNILNDARVIRQANTIEEWEITFEFAINKPNKIKAKADNAYTFVKNKLGLGKIYTQLKFIIEK